MRDLLGWASATRRMIPARAVASPVAVTRTRRLPEALIVPAMTRSPGPLATGCDSPVIIASFTSDAPSTTSPSAGTLPPGRTRTVSPSARRSTRTSSVLLSGRRRSAVSGRGGQLVEGA